MSKDLSADALATLDYGSAQDRYDYLIDSVSKEKELWILTGKEGSVLLTSEGDDCVPVWPFKVIAEKYISGDWADCKAIAISLKDWKQRWTQGLTDDELFVAVYPNQQQECIVLSATEFDEEL